MKAFKYKQRVNLTLEQAKLYQDNWNLTEDQKASLDTYCLRQWTASELADNLIFPTNSDIRVHLWNQEFMPVFTGPREIWQKILYLAVRDKDLAATALKHTTQPMYWLSFRSGMVEGKRFSYVIIQEDKK